MIEMVCVADSLVISLHGKEIRPEEWHRLTLLVKYLPESGTFLITTPQLYPVEKGPLASVTPLPKRAAGVHVVEPDDDPGPKAA